MVELTGTEVGFGDSPTLLTGSLVISMGFIGMEMPSLTVLG